MLEFTPYQEKTLEEQFSELAKKAKEIYPDIEDSIYTLSNSVNESVVLNDFLFVNSQFSSVVTSNEIL